jgi:hypothetical protein
LTATSALWLLRLKSPSNGPASHRAASSTALAIWLLWLAPRTTSRMPAAMTQNTTVPTSSTRRAIAARASSVRAAPGPRGAQRRVRNVLISAGFPFDAPSSRG